MKTGDFVEVDYVGRMKDTGEIFDLTKEDVAKKENVYNPKVSYKSVVLIVGAGFIIKGLDEALQEMKVGEKKKIEIPPEKAFGGRQEELVKLVPLSKFKEQEQKPSPGAVISVGNMRGKIASVDGGRVKIDFNHPLAGKTLEYDIELKSLVEKQEDRIKAIVAYFTGLETVGVSFNGKEAEIEIKKDVDIVRAVKSMIAETAIKWCGVDKVKFVEIFEKQKYENQGEK